MVASGEFRDDLFYRLNVFPVTVAAAARTSRDDIFLRSRRTSSRNTRTG